MDERWLQLLSYWQKYEFRQALTFPFLVGALRVPIGAKIGSGTSAKEEITGLVDSIRSHRASGYFNHIYRCPDLGQLVITRVANSLPGYAIAIPSHHVDAKPSLYASGVLAADVVTPVTSLVEIIWTEVGAAIVEGDFSCRGRRFAPFSDAELSTIRKALA